MKVNTARRGLVWSSTVFSLRCCVATSRLCAACLQSSAVSIFAKEQSIFGKVKLVVSIFSSICKGWIHISSYGFPVPIVLIVTPNCFSVATHSSSYIWLEVCLTNVKVIAAIAILYKVDGMVDKENGTDR